MTSPVLGLYFRCGHEERDLNRGKTMTELKTIKLSQIANEVGDYVDQVPALDPSRSRRRPVIVEQSTGKPYIVDGFHRAAGMVRWCRENDVTLADCEINVVMCDDDDLISVACEPGDGQENAIDAIYELAGV